MNATDAHIAQMQADLRRRRQLKDLTAAFDAEQPRPPNPYDQQNAERSRIVAEQRRNDAMMAEQERVRAPAQSAAPVDSFSRTPTLRRMVTPHSPAPMPRSRAPARFPEDAPSGDADFVGNLRRARAEGDRLARIAQERTQAPGYLPPNPTLEQRNAVTPTGGMQAREGEVITGRDGKRYQKSAVGFIDPAAQTGTHSGEYGMPASSESLFAARRKAEAALADQQWDHQAEQVREAARRLKASVTTTGVRSDRAGHRRAFLEDRPLTPDEMDPTGFFRRPRRPMFE